MQSLCAFSLIEIFWEQWACGCDRTVNPCHHCLIYFTTDKKSIWSVGVCVFLLCGYMKLVTLSVYQWRSVPFKMTEDDKKLLWAWPYFYYSTLDDIHIPFTQLNVTLIGLGYYNDTQIFPITIMSLIQPSLWMKVYKVGAQVERNLNKTNALVNPLQSCSTV